MVGDVCNHFDILTKIFSSPHDVIVYALTFFIFMPQFSIHDIFYVCDSIFCHHYVIFSPYDVICYLQHILIAETLKKFYACNQSTCCCSQC